MWNATRTQYNKRHSANTNRTRRSGTVVASWHTIRYYCYYCIMLADRIAIENSIVLKYKSNTYIYIYTRQQILQIVRIETYFLSDNSEKWVCTDYRTYIRIVHLVFKKKKKKILIDLFITLLNKYIVFSALRLVCL